MRHPAPARTLGPSLPVLRSRARSNRLVPVDRAQARAHERENGGDSGYSGSGGSGGAAPASRRRVLAALPPCACAVCAAGPASAAAQKGVRNEALDRLFAASMATGMAEYEQSIAPLKRQLFSQLLGTLPAAPPAAAAAMDAVSEEGQSLAQLLELGVGTGPNLAYYSSFYGLPSPVAAAEEPSSRGSSSSRQGPLPSSLLPPVQITGVDPNPFMRPYLEENLAGSGWPAERFSWVQGRAEALPLADASLDAVVCTLVRGRGAVQGERQH